MKVVCGLGNPGPEYETTRHNVGWRLADHLREAWRFDAFRRVRAARLTEGERHGEPVALLKPTTYMNRSGAALAPLVGLQGFDIAQDLLVVVDDVALAFGRLRCRARGSAGGHNGLKSIEAVLRTQAYARLRVGVGAAPPGWDMADWVLSPFTAEEEDALEALLPVMAEVVDVWIREGIEAAAAHCGRAGP